MRKILTFLFAALMSVGMWAAPVPCGDNLSWEFDSSSGTLTITGTGDMYDYDGEMTYAPWVSYYESITSVIISNGVTSIGNLPFFNCIALTSVTIPNSVTSIGAGAFYMCSSLASIEIPNSVESIGMYAFAGCTGLTSVTIPNSVTSIGEGAFQIVPNIVYFGSATGSPWGARSVNGYVDGFLVYSDNTKTNLLACSSQATGTIEIPNSVTSIGNYTFYNCSNLESVTILAESLESYGSGAFEGTAEGLKIYVPAGSVNTYKAGWAAYEDKIVAIVVNPVQIGDLYYNLDADNMTAEVTYQEFMSETNYSSLTAVNIPESVEYNSVTYSVTSIGMAAFLYCQGLTSVTIPNSVTSIGYGAFYGCTGLTPVTIPNSVTSIGDYAFYACFGLTSIEIPNSVESIGEYAFDECQGLTSVTIGNSVTSIGKGAFYICSGLASVTINATTPPTLGSSAFYGTAEGLKIYVPAEESVVADYKAAENWSAYADKIEPIAGGDEPEPQEITPNVDPQNPAVYYSTFYDSAKKYKLPAGVEAYVATIGENVLNLTRIAEAGQVIPNDNAVILKSTVTPFTLTPSEAAPVTFTVDNSLQGTDVAIATPDNCYVLGGADGVVGFYPYSGTNLNPHKAYVVFSGSNNAPRRMPFIFDAATGVENVQGNVQSTKVLRDGQLIIIRNGVEYNANGMMVK